MSSNATGTGTGETEFTGETTGALVMRFSAFVLASRRCGVEHSPTYWPSLTASGVSTSMVRRDSVDKGQRYGFPTAVSGDAVDDYPVKKDPSEAPAIVRWLKPDALMQRVGQYGHPWIGWAFVYGIVLLVFFIYRCTALKALFAMYASVKDGTPSIVLGALTLGLLEDFVCATYFACALWLFDSLKAATVRCFPQLKRPGIAQFISKAVTFLVSWLLFLAMTVPFVADVIIVRLRDMRFTFDIVTMAIDEKDNATSFEVSNDEVVDAVLNAVALVVVATFFAVVRTWAPWADLSNWNPTQLFPKRLIVSALEAQQGSSTNTDPPPRWTRKTSRTARTPAAPRRTRS